MKRIRVKYSKLGKLKSWGIAHCGDNLIEVDQRLIGKKQLEILVHESLHILFPELEEEEVEQKAIILTNTLWHEGFRKVDLKNTIPLQDGRM